MYKKITIVSLWCYSFALSCDVELQLRRFYFFKDYDNVMRLKSIIEKDPQDQVHLNVVDNHGRSLVHRAVLAGDYAAVNFLCYFGADVNKVDRYGNSPLHLAVKVVDAKKSLVPLLLHYGADPDALNYAGKNPYDINSSVPFIAGSDTASVDALLVDAMHKTLVEYYTRVQTLYSLCISSLLVNRVNTDLLPPTVVAAMHEQQVWLTRKLSVHTLGIAHELPPTKHLVRLIERGADVNSVDICKTPLLHRLINMRDLNNPLLFKALFDAGVDVDMPDAIGNTCLHKLAIIGVHIFLYSTADVKKAYGDILKQVVALTKDIERKNIDDNTAKDIILAPLGYIHKIQRDDLSVNLGGEYYLYDIKPLKELQGVWQDAGVLPVSEPTLDH